MTSFCSSLHTAAKRAGIPNKILRPKKYWRPDLSRARDTKRFWWNLWVVNVRSRSGQVFACYKNTKRLFRKLSRECVKSMDNDFYHSLDNLLTRDNNKFWQHVRARRICNVPSSLTADQFVEHYSSIMTDGNELSTTQRSITDDVKSNYSKLQDQIIPHSILVEHIYHVISLEAKTQQFPRSGRNFS